MRSRVENVTPAMARRWIEASEEIRQRSIRPTRVHKLEHAIRSGQWLTTHQGIALDPEGRILDGQHRLRAIVAADHAVRILVARDVDPAAFGVIDTGLSRSPADTLRIAGHSNAVILAAMVRAVIAYDQVVGERGSVWAEHDKAITSADILEYLEDPEMARTAAAAIETGTRVGRAVSRYGAATPLAAAFHILMTRPTDVTPTVRAEFAERLVDGANLGTRSPILVLRRWLVADTGYVTLTHSVRRISTVAITIKAVNDYALGHERSVYAFKANVETVPAPIPPGAIRASMIEREAELEAAEREEAGV